MSSPHDEEEILARERAIDEWFLLALRGRHHIVAHYAEQLVDFHSRRRQTLYQRRHERTVRPLPVERDLPMFRRIGNECPAFRLDAAKPAADRARRHGPAHLPRKRIVAAGIKDDEPEFSRGLDRP